MNSEPGHRYKKIVDAVRRDNQPADALEFELWKLLKNQDASVEVKRAFDIYQHLYKREVIEAFLLVEASFEEIHQVLRVPAEVTKTYASLFFDTTVFEDELDRIDYAHTYKGDAFGKSLKKFAVDLGKESLKIKMSRGRYTVKPSEVQNEILSTCFVMGQMVKMNPTDSDISRESLKWAQLGLKASVDSEVDEDTSNIDKIKFELDSKDETVDIEKAGVNPEDIIH